MMRFTMLVPVLTMAALAAACSGKDEAKEPVAGDPTADAADGADPAADATANESAGGGLGNALSNAVANAQPAAQPAAPVAAPVAPAAAPAANAEGKYLWVFIDDLNVRAQPSATAAKVGKLAWGVKVEVLAETDGFVKIAEGQFVARRHLTDRKARFTPRVGH